MNFANYFDEASMHKISNVISAFDTGISQVSVQEISIEQLEKELPRPIFEDLLRQVRKGVEQSDGERVHVNINLRSERSFYNVSLRKGQEPRITTLDLRHKQSFYNFRLKKNRRGPDGCSISWISCFAKGMGSYTLWMNWRGASTQSLSNTICGCS